MNLKMKLLKMIVNCSKSLIITDEFFIFIVESLKLDIIYMIKV